MNTMNKSRVRSFLDNINAWAENQPDLLAVALVGSHACGEAKPESDLDLILLVRDPDFFIENRDWVAEFGNPSVVYIEDWGKVTSLRVYFADGLEVEFGLTDPSWGADPDDLGTADVIANGLIILHEKDTHLSCIVTAYNVPPTSISAN